jgi:regulatory protein
MLIDKAYIEKNLIAPSRGNHSKSKQTSSSVEEPNKSTLDAYNNNPEDAFKKIERLLSVRDRSVTEIINRLQTEHFTEEAIHHAVQRALRCNYLNDERFADSFIRARLRASKGINGIVRDLKNHGIDAYSISGFPDSYIEETGSQLENAIYLLERKPPRAKNIQQAAYAKLVRNGFSSSVASSAVKAWLAK